MLFENIEDTGRRNQRRRYIHTHIYMYIYIYRDKAMCPIMEDDVEENTLPFTIALLSNGGHSQLLEVFYAQLRLDYTE